MIEKLLKFSLSLAALVTLMAASPGARDTFSDVPQRYTYQGLEFAIGVPVKGRLHLVSEGKDGIKWSKKRVIVYGQGWSYGGVVDRQIKTECKSFRNAGVKLIDPLYGDLSVANMKKPLLVARDTKDKSRLFRGTGTRGPVVPNLPQEELKKYLSFISQDLSEAPSTDTISISHVVGKENYKMVFISLPEAKLKDGNISGIGWLLEEKDGKIKTLRKDLSAGGTLLQAWADVNQDEIPDVFLFEAVGTDKSDLAALVFTNGKWYKLAGIAPCG